MKKRGWCLGVALCAALTGCGPKTAQVTPVPQPSATLETTAPTVVPTVSPELTETPEPTKAPEPTVDPAPDPQNDPKGHVLSRVDKMLDEETIFLRFWIHPGSGPTPSYWTTSAVGATVREMFEDLDWDNAELLTWEETFDDEMWDVPGYTVSLYDDQHGVGGSINCGLNRGTIYVFGENDEGFYFRVDGAEKLCEKLTDMEPSVYVNMGRTRVPPQKSPEDTVKLYVETALKRTKKCGHITDYAIRAYEVTSFSEGDPPNGISYIVTYAFKPAHPELWANLDADGWVEESIDWECLDYDERDGCYGMG